MRLAIEAVYFKRCLKRLFVSMLYGRHLSSLKIRTSEFRPATQLPFGKVPQNDLGFSKYKSLLSHKKKTTLRAVITERPKAIPIFHISVYPYLAVPCICMTFVFWIVASTHRLSKLLWERTAGLPSEDIFFICSKAFTEKFRRS